MESKSLTIIAASIVGLLILCMGTVASCGASSGAMASACAGASFQPPTTTGTDPLGRYDGEQLTNVATIIHIGQAKSVPPWGWIIAVATARQESSLRNLPDLGAGNDHDSIGLFQQRPSQGWGTREQLADPAYQAGKFFDKLLTVAGWQTMPLTDAAQAVQRSAYPDAYAKWTPDAIALVSTVGSTIPEASPGILEQCVSMAGWVQPVRALIVSGFRTEARPSHDGVDLGAARGTPIRAASEGTVVVAACNISPASWGCDRDGNSSVPGCGWYVDIRHLGDVYTRYCHMLGRPSVVVGQQVLAGQVIGFVGSSGNSSGPHLHFEVHLGGQSSATAVDPAPFMAASGAPLGG